MKFPCPSCGLCYGTQFRAHASRPLAEIRELLELSFAPNSVCEHVRQRAEAKIIDIENKIRSLQRMKRSLRNIVQRCKTKESFQDCPLVHGTADVDTEQDESRIDKTDFGQHLQERPLSDGSGNSVGPGTFLGDLPSSRPTPGCKRGAAKVHK